MTRDASRGAMDLGALMNPTDLLERKHERIGKQLEELDTTDLENLERFYPPSLPHPHGTLQRTSLAHISRAHLAHQVDAAPQSSLAFSKRCFLQVSVP